MTYAMKQTFFPALLFFISACNVEDNSGVKKSVARKKLPEVNDTNQRIISYNDTEKLPFRTETDSGYFRGYTPEKIDSLEYADTNMLSKVLASIVSKKDIILLGKETLSHSVFINQKNKIRIDTLQNKETIIVSIYGFGGKKYQTIKINGKILKQNFPCGDDRIYDLPLDIESTSFRHFSFKGKVYYYMAAYALDMQGSSIGNINHHLLYDSTAGKLSVFTSWRFGQVFLFGDADGDDKLDFLDFNNDGMSPLIPYDDSALIHLYSCDKKGNFNQQKDATGNFYYISANTGNKFRQDSLNIKKYNWPVPINY